MNIDEAVTRACTEPTLVKALTWIAIWDTERIVKQAACLTNTAAHGGKWDTCFERCFSSVIARWKKLTGIGDSFLPDHPEMSRILAPLVAIADAYDNNELDEARPTWCKGLDQDRKVELVQGRGGRTLLTLGQALDARDVL